MYNVSLELPNMFADDDVHYCIKYKLIVILLVYVERVRYRETGGVVNTSPKIVSLFALHTNILSFIGIEDRLQDQVFTTPRRETADQGVVHIQYSIVRLPGIELCRSTITVS